MFNLHVVQAENGDCFLLEFCSEGKKPKYILIDGGDRGIYENYLSKVLKEKVKSNTLELVVVSHIDNDHIFGINRLLKNRYEEKNNTITIKDIWFNGFTNAYGLTDEDEKDISNCIKRINDILYGEEHVIIDGEVISVDEIDESTRSEEQATLLLFWASKDKLDLEVNRHFNYDAASIDNLKSSTKIDNLEIKVIGPNTKQLLDLATKWFDWIIKKCPEITQLHLAEVDEELVLEVEKTKPNLSSIMFLVIADENTQNEKKILFTGDGFRDDIIEGLNKHYPNQESFFVDVLKVPHHGSVRNVSPDFFDKVQAKKYVITGNHGRHTNPELETLKWIVEAAERQNREIEIYVTNKTPYVKELLKIYPEEDSNYTLHYLKKDEISMVIKL